MVGQVRGQVRPGLGRLPFEDATFVETIAAAGFQVRHERRNDDRCISDRALDACGSYEVQSVSFEAVKPADLGAA